MEMPSKATTIIKQVAAKLTSYGFPNQPMPSVRSVDGGFQTEGCKAALHLSMTETVEVWEITELVPTGPVYALVVNKGHDPWPAHHVVDFRVGGNIYGDPAKF
jgi:hypothetical protein